MPTGTNFIIFDIARAFGLVNGVACVEVMWNVLRGAAAKNFDVQLVEDAQLRFSVPTAESLNRALQTTIGEAEDAPGASPKPNTS